MPPLFGKRNAAKGEVNLVAYSIRLDPAIVAIIKELQAKLALKSQGEVITMAVKLLFQGESTNEPHG